MCGVGRLYTDWSMIWSSGRRRKKGEGKGNEEANMKVLKGGLGLSMIEAVDEEGKGKRKRGI